MSKVTYNRTDDDGHKYVIPEELLEEFDHLNEMIQKQKWGSDRWYDLIDEFNNKFFEYNMGR